MLEDSSPAQLGVFVSLNIGGYDVASRNQAVLDINFQHAGSPVAFIADERVTCNGVTLKRFQGGFFEFHFEVDPLPVVPAGIACTYSSDGHSAALSVPVPPMLKVVLPTDHERVSRGPHTLVQFSRPQQAGLWVVALSVNAKAAGEVQEMTPTEAIVDTRELTIGDGSIAVTDPNSFPLDVRGPAFQFVQGSARRSTMIPVVWI